jgi:hypothetical protein
VKTTCTALRSSENFLNRVQNLVTGYNCVAVGEIGSGEHGYILPVEYPLRALRGPILIPTPKIRKQFLSPRLFMVKKIFSHTKPQT